MPGVSALSAGSLSPVTRLSHDLAPPISKAFARDNPYTLRFLAVSVRHKSSGNLGKSVVKPEFARSAIFNEVARFRVD
jgi:hypothetical protein